MKKNKDIILKVKKVILKIKNFVAKKSSLVKSLFALLNVKNFIFITIAGIINAVGVTVFLSPVGLFDSGISGTSMLLSGITSLSLSVFLIILNVPLFLYGYKKQGFAFTAYSVYSVMVYSLTAWVITDVLPINVIGSSPLAGKDILLCAVFGGLVSGCGSGLTIRFGGAIDGIEVMAVIFAKALSLSVGTFVMIYNVILYIICAIISGNWILPLYSIITYYVALKTVDFIVEGVDRSKGVMIVTSKPEEICSALMDEFSCGTTKIAATGGYSNLDKTLIYFVVNRFQIAKMRNIVTSCDPYAFMTINEVADVFRSSFSNVK